MRTVGVDTAHKNLGLSVLEVQDDLKVSKVLISETFRPDGPEKLWEKHKRAAKKAGLPIRESIFMDDFLCCARYRELNRTLGPFDLACLEAATYSKRGSAMVSIGAIHGTLLQATMDLNIPFLYLPPNKIKLAFTGNGSAEKEEVLAVVTKLVGDNSFDSNQSDSIAMAWIAAFWGVAMTEGFSKALGKVPEFINKDWLTDAFCAHKPINKRTRKRPGVVFRKEEFFWIPEGSKYHGIPTS